MMKSYGYFLENLRIFISILKLKMLPWVCIFIIFVIPKYDTDANGNSAANNSSNKIIDGQLQLPHLYDQIQPTEKRPSYNVFAIGMRGYHTLLKENKLQNQRYLTLIDFSLSSTVKRLWVLDTQSMEVIHHSLVSHGKNTGNEYAVKFSNVVSSNMSSLGFFLTGNTYIGKHGFSLKLEGIEKEINDNAKKRAIVIHGAEYASHQFIAEYGRLGRSFGCPALPISNCKPIIDTIKGKSCLFIYYPDEDYFGKSKYVEFVQQETGIRN